MTSDGRRPMRAPDGEAYAPPPEHGRIVLRGHPNEGGCVCGCPLAALAASATDEAERHEPELGRRPSNLVWRKCVCGAWYWGGEQSDSDKAHSVLARPAVPALDVERLAEAMGRVIDTDDITLLRSDASLIAREYAALSPKEPTE